MARIADNPHRHATADEWSRIRRRLRVEAALMTVGAATLLGLAAMFAWLGWDLRDQLAPTIAMGVLVLLCLPAGGAVAYIARSSLRGSANLPRNLPVVKLAGTYRVGPRPPASIGYTPVHFIGRTPSLPNRGWVEAEAHAYRAPGETTPTYLVLSAAPSAPPDDAAESERPRHSST